MRAFFKWVRDNSLTIVFLFLFVLTLAGQSWTGCVGYNDQLGAHGRPPIHYGKYLSTGNFLDGIVCNWQAAILQLGCLIVFSGIFRQRGASHSLKSEDPKKSNRQTTAKKKGRRGRKRDGEGCIADGNSWLYCNSLSVAFGLLFLGSFCAHVVFGTWLYNETNAMTGGAAAVSVGTFVRSATFWFRTLQTWEAEFGVIAVFIVLSIFLRQEGSAESKPVGSSDAETGETNK